MKIYVGDDVRLTATFRDADAALVDPESIAVRISAPSGIVTTQVYPSGTVSRVSLGVFRLLVNADESGKWIYKITSAGQGKAGKPGFFYVTPDSDAQS